MAGLLEHLTARREILQVKSIDLHTISAIIFDLDGVLVDSWEAWYSLVNFTLDHYGKGSLTREQFQSIWGQGMEADREMFFPDITVEELKTFYDEHFLRFVEKVTCFEDTRPVLKALLDRRVVTALASNSPRRVVDAVLDAHELTSLFRFTVASDEVARSKPAPDMIDELRVHLCLDRSRIAFVGDSRYDLEAAAAAGVLFIGYERDGDLRINRLGDLLTPEGTGKAG